MFRSLTSKKLFLALSAMLFIGDAIFVALNYVSDRKTLAETLEHESLQLEKSFQVALSMSLTNMSQLATFVASSKDVRHLFQQAEEAVKAEGGGAGGDDSARLRAQLYNLVAPGWERMTQQYQVRQLHFHLGPGSTSFLRVHKPSKFGDNMDDLRHMIVDVNHDSQPREGFELGRVYAGLRGVVPVYSTETNPVVVGALEVGTSFSVLIDSLSQAVGQNVAVLLREKRVEDATWERPEEPIKTGCGCFIEATSSPELNDLLTARIEAQWSSPSLGVRSDMLFTSGGAMAVTEFGLPDYIGLRDGHEAPVGRVMIWRSVEEELETLRQNTVMNVLYALVAFVLLEVVLYSGIRLSVKQLERSVRERTEEVSSLNAQLEIIANQDYLTGVCTRRYFMERLEQEVSRRKRVEPPLSLIMLDIDHFKKINDQYGHIVGDQVLSSLGELLHDHCRQYDVVGRYGGEEFCLLLQGVGADIAQSRAESLRKLIQETVPVPDNPEITVTVSIGIAEYAPGSNQKTWIDSADQALYEAKSRGRNCTVVYGA